MEELNRYFSQDYSAARARFLEKGKVAGAVLEQIPLEAKAPSGNALTIDIAWFGSQSPKRVLVHTSGLHGVEGFAGSAIQIKSMEAVPAIGKNDAILFVHVLNPFGMSWLRRTNENNVDLNRNFVFPDENRVGSEQIYRNLDPFLNPTKRRLFDAFLPKMGLSIFKFGFRNVKQALVLGQYEFERGIFFGGKQLQPGPLAFLNWLVERLKGIEYLFSIDVHTGLGSWLQESLFWENEYSNLAELNQFLGRNVVRKSDKSVGYDVLGGLQEVYRHLPNHPPYDHITQEFGTFSPVRVLRVMREENFVFHHESKDLNHSIKQWMKACFDPPAEDWKMGVLEHGFSLFENAVTWTFKN